MPLAKFPTKKRPDRLSIVVATLGLILYAVASPFSPASVATPVHLSPVPAPGSTVYGNDISWPQCAKRDGGNGLPGPQASASFAVLGLTDGGSFRANPCLASQVASVRSRHLWAGAYAISTYPTDAELARYGGTGTLTQQLRRVGAAQARFNLDTMARVGLQPPMVWVDVEPSKRTPWAAGVDKNNAVIDGVIAGYQAAGKHAGIYSYDKAWKAITGARSMPGVPTWVPVGLASRSEAEARCAAASYAGSKPRLTQWTDDVYDYNLTCPGVTGAGRTRQPSDARQPRMASAGCGHRQVHSTGARLHGHPVRVNLSNVPGTSPRASFVELVESECDRQMSPGRGDLHTDAVVEP